MKVVTESPQRLQMSSLGSQPQPSSSTLRLRDAQQDQIWICLLTPELARNLPKQALHRHHLLHTLCDGFHRIRNFVTQLIVEFHAGICFYCSRPPSTSGPTSRLRI